MDELLKHEMDDIHTISSRDELRQGKHQMSQQNNDVAYRLHSGGKLGLSRYRKVEREDKYVGKRVMAIEVSGNRRRGRPEQRWLDSIRNELSREDVQDRAKRRHLIRHIDPT